MSNGDSSSNDSENNDIIILFGPDSALPSPLQGIPYAKDVWRRIKSHPVVSPKLKRDELAEDAETRELVHTILEAADEREKEVLLYNQARVFSVVLQSVVNGLGKFLSRPIIPIPSVAAINGTAVPSNVDIEGGGDEKQPLWKTILISFLIPKYIIFVVLAVLGLAVGFSGWRNYQLTETIKTLETANDAAEISRKSLDSLRTEFQIMEDRLKQELTKANSEISRLSAENLTSAESLREMEKEKDKLATKNSELTKQLSNDKKEESELAKSVTALTAKLAVAESDLKTLRANLVEEKTRFKKAQTARQQAIESYNKVKFRLDDQVNTNADLANENTLLLKYRTSYGIAKTCLDAVKREAGRYYPNVSKIKDSVEMCEKTISQTLSN